MAHIFSCELPFPKDRQQFEEVVKSVFDGCLIDFSVSLNAYADRSDWQLVMNHAPNGFARSAWLFYDEQAFTAIEDRLRQWLQEYEVFRRTGLMYWGVKCKNPKCAAGIYLYSNVEPVEGCNYVVGTELIRCGVCGHQDSYDQEDGHFQGTEDMPGGTPWQERNE